MTDHISDILSWSDWKLSKGLPCSSGTVPALKISVLSNTQVRKRYFLVGWSQSMQHYFTAEKVTCSVHFAPNILGQSIFHSTNEVQNMTNEKQRKASCLIAGARRSSAYCRAMWSREPTFGKSQPRKLFYLKTSTSYQTGVRTVYWVCQSNTSRLLLLLLRWYRNFELLAVWEMAVASNQDEVVAHLVLSIFE